MAIFWLKLNELLYFEEKSQSKPILLLDDIFSELDDHNRELVMKVIKEYQTIATTTEEEIKDLSQMPEEVIRL
jgi:DNA replication and repair protein RecF